MLARTVGDLLAYSFVKAITKKVTPPEGVLLQLFYPRVREDDVILVARGAEGVYTLRYFPTGSSKLYNLHSLEEAFQEEWDGPIDEFPDWYVVLRKELARIAATLLREVEVTTVVKKLVIPQDKKYLNVVGTKVIFILTWRDHTYRIESPCYQTGEDVKFGKVFVCPYCGADSDYVLVKRIIPRERDVSLGEGISEEDARRWAKVAYVDWEGPVYCPYCEGKITDYLNHIYFLRNGVVNTLSGKIVPNEEIPSAFLSRLV